MVTLHQNYTITLIYVHTICTLKGTLFTNSAKWEGYILVDYSVPSEVIITVLINFTRIKDVGIADQQKA